MKEYIPTLQMRRKWRETSRNFKKGDIVVVVDDLKHRNQWPLARVIGTYPSADGLVRSVRVRVRGVELDRPVAKLCLVEEAKWQEELNEI